MLVFEISERTRRVNVQ